MPSDQAITKLERVHKIVQGCIDRRAAGERLPDEMLMRDHPDLMPELARELKKLALLEQAEHRAEARTQTFDAAEALLREPRLSGMDRTPANYLPGYIIVGEIHRGGQGIVYRAVQSSPRRDVAIKFVRAGPGGGAPDRGRLDREVQILAQLSHPNIVKIHECGQADGRLYYTMDYVDGQALDDYIAAHQPPLRQMLELFLKICDAVNAAHLRGVIHRDLKPGNILVNSEAEPFVLDFGLAKLTQDAEASQALTLSGQFVGSLPWASPEQARGDCGHVDVRTDVYALGVVLYQMLTGRFPYDVVGSSRQVLDHIIHAEPVRPGTIRRHLAGEIETILLKCLAKEPERRYQSAGELARDIRHHLAGEPIEAKHDSTFYLLRKTLHRYRKAAAVVASFSVLLVIALITTSAQYLRAEHARTRAVQQQYFARIAAANAALASNDVATARFQLEQAPAEHRNWEWRYLNAALDTSVAVLRGHAGAVRGVSFSPDGKRLVSGGDDGTIRFWDVLAERQTELISNAGSAVAGVAYAPDAARIAVIRRNGNLSVWDVADEHNPQIVWQHEAHQPFGRCLAFSSDGRLLASGGRGDPYVDGSDQYARLWDAESGLLLREFGPLKGCVVSAVAFSPDGQYLAAAAWNDKTALVWDIRSGQERACLYGHRGGVSGFTFTADGTQLITASQDQSIGIFTLDDGRQRSIWGHTRTLRGIAITAAGDRLISAADDRTCRVWDYGTGQVLSVLHGHEGRLLAVDYCPETQLVATGSEDGTVRVWDLVTDRQRACIGEHDEWVFGLSFDRSGTRLAAVDADDSCRLWDWIARKPLGCIRDSFHYVRGAAFSPTEDRLLTVAQDHSEGGACAVYHACMWDSLSGALLAELTNVVSYGAQSAAFSPDGRTFATGLLDHRVCVWDAATCQPQLTFTGHKDLVCALAFDPTGRLLFSGSRDGSIIMWDVSESAQAARLVGHTGAIVALAVSPDSRILASASLDGTLRLWEATTGALRQVVATKLTGLAFMPDGSRLVGASGSALRLFDPQNGDEVVVLRQATSYVTTVACSPDGSCILGGGDEWMVRIWDTVPYRVRYRERLACERNRLQVGRTAKEARDAK